MQDDEPLIDVESAGFPVMLVVVVVVLAGVSILVYRTYCRKSFTGARATLAAGCAPAFSDSHSRVLLTRVVRRVCPVRNEERLG